FVSNRPLPNLVTAVLPVSPFSTANQRTGRDTASASSWLIGLLSWQSEQVHSTTNASRSFASTRKYGPSILTFLPSITQTVGPRSSMCSGSLAATPTEIASAIRKMVTRFIYRQAYPRSALTIEARTRHARPGENCGRIWILRTMFMLSSQMCRLAPNVRQYSLLHRRDGVLPLARGPLTPAQLHWPSSTLRSAALA